MAAAKFKINYSVIALLIVLFPLLILSLHYSNRQSEDKMSGQREPTAEDFAASQGGAFIQLATSKVPTEAEAAANYEYEKRQTIHDILNMTEPELYPGPKPAVVNFSMK